MVRHGQASFMEANYDKLSTVGEGQARLLGQWWATHGVRLDRIYTGPRARQQRSALLAGEAYRELTGFWPEPVLLEDLDEMQTEDVLKRAMPGLLTTHPDVVTLVEAFQSAGDPKETAKKFQKLFERVVAMWAKGELQVQGVEPWDAFVARTHAVIRKMCGDGGGLVAAFTSAGPVSAAMQRALGTDADTTLQLAWMVRNASVSEFLFTADRFSLSSFNTMAHLPDRANWTYR